MSGTFSLINVNARDADLPIHSIASAVVNGSSESLANVPLIGCRERRERTRDAYTSRGLNAIQADQPTSRLAQHWAGVGRLTTGDPRIVRRARRAENTSEYYRRLRGRYRDCKAKRQYLLTWKVGRYCLLALHSKHDTLTQCWVDVGPPSSTSAQHQPGIGSMYRVFAG